MVNATVNEYNSAEIYAILYTQASVLHFKPYFNFKYSSHSVISNGEHTLLTALDGP
jgi:hypothetical protein